MVFKPWRNCYYSQDETPATIFTFALFAVCCQRDKMSCLNSDARGWKTCFPIKSLRLSLFIWKYWAEKRIMNLCHWQQHCFVGICHFYHQYISGVQSHSLLFFQKIKLISRKPILTYSSFSTAMIRSSFFRWIEQRPFSSLRLHEVFSKPSDGFNHGVSPGIKNF